MRGHMVRLIAILTFPLLAILAITAPELVPWLFGSEWSPAVVPMQILAVGGASTLVIDAVGVALMASGRPRALLGFGFGHFGTYAGAVLIATPWGLAGVAAAATIVHTAFMVVAYKLMVRGTDESWVRHLWADVGPATVGSLGLVAVGGAGQHRAVGCRHADPRAARGRHARRARGLRADAAPDLPDRLRHDRHSWRSACCPRPPRLPRPRRPMEVSP